MCSSEEDIKDETCPRRIQQKCKLAVYIARSYSTNRRDRPEAMGLVCGLVYLLAIIFFLPFAFKRDIVEVTSGAGNKDSILEAQDIENGRKLHRFPLEKVWLSLSSMLHIAMLIKRSLHHTASHTAL